MERTYRRLSLNERVVIETLLTEKKSIDYIAIQLNRNRSTVRNEVKRWVVRPTDIYKADLAHWCAAVRPVQCDAAHSGCCTGGRRGKVCR